MEITEQQKNKILKWICKKSGIEKLFLENGCLCCQKSFTLYSGNAYITQYHIFAFTEEDTILIRCNSNNDILEKIIDLSSKGYTISNSSYIKILSPFTSLEQLAVEADLNV